MSYDRHQRNPEHKAFYNSAAWIGKPNGARTIKVRSTPVCERCESEVVYIVHHIIPLDECTPEQRIAQSNLMSVCLACHNAIHGESDNPTPPHVTGQIELAEDDEFEFDQQRATAVPRFAAKFCNHWRGSLRGQPFVLHPIQCAIIEPVYGLVHRITRQRRIQSLWLESGIGSGKTPLMAICGLEHLLGGAEPGAQIYSISNTFGQANHMFEAAKTFIKNNEHLSRLVDRGKLAVKQYEIYYRPTDSRWHITSGTGAKAGGAASLILADEIHQVESRAVYDDLQGRQSKRDQPLIICATNAAKHPHALYADLHEEAVHTLTGGARANRRLFPVIWAASKDADPSAPASWREANPLIGVTIEESKIADEWTRAKGSPALESRFRLQYLGQPVSDVSKWINLDHWDRCVKPLDAAVIAKLPRYVSLDWSRGDDLCAVVYVYVAPDRYYVRSRFLLPRKTADEYRESHDIRFDEWATAGAITLLDEETISVAVHERVAAELIAEHKVHPFVKVCADRAYADHIIAAIEAAKIPLEKIGQGWGVSSGCAELERRLKEGSITIEPNPVLRWCAENVEIKHDERGNFWPVKPGAKNKYAGTRSSKIDGISGLVTNLTESRKHDFPKCQQISTAKAWLV